MKERGKNDGGAEKEDALYEHKLAAATAAENRMEFILLALIDGEYWCDLFYLL